MEIVHFNYSINRKHTKRLHSILTAKLHSILTAKLPRLCDIMDYNYEKATGNCPAMARERMQ